MHGSKDLLWNRRTRIKWGANIPASAHACGERTAQFSARSTTPAATASRSLFCSWMAKLLLLACAFFHISIILIKRSKILIVFYLSKCFVQTKPDLINSASQYIFLFFLLSLNL
jgi:hypothetical protein